MDGKKKARVESVAGGAERSQGERARAQARELAEAAWAGDSSRAARLLAAGADPNGGSRHGGDAALMGACSCKDAELAAALLAAGADPKAATWRGETALMMAAREGAIGCARLLVGVDPGLARAAMEGGETALHLAARFRALDVAELLAPISDPQARTRDGLTALHVAAHRADPEMVRALLPWSDPLARDKRGDSALAWAVASSFEGAMRCVELLAPDSDLDRKNDAGRRPDQTAAARSSEPMRRYLAALRKARKERAVLGEACTPAPLAPGGKARL